MSTPNFTVIEGSLLIDPKVSGGDFVSAEATDTRLMGVVGLHIIRDRNGDSFHQFFYIDTEEYGLDDYQSFFKMEPEEIENKRAELFGALGGNWKSITEKEALYLVKQAAKINNKYKLPLPKGVSEFRPIIESEVVLSLEERALLWQKITSTIRNDYELINYFLMRMIACDNEGMSRLSGGKGDIRYVNIANPGTLLKNEISNKTTDDEVDDSSSRTYTCVSLMDIDKVYQLLESEIEVSDTQVIRFHHKKPMPISPWEASLILNQPEFLVHATMEDRSDAPDCDKHFSKVMTSLFGTVTESEYDFGSLFMVFRKNNDHVRKKVYRLDQDTIGVVCRMHSGELVFAANDMLHVETLEKSVLAAAALENIGIKVHGRYKFPEAILVRFIDSDFDRFSEFLEYIQSFQDR